jgi:hypothetical protein
MDPLTYRLDYRAVGNASFHLRQCAMKYVVFVLGVLQHVLVRMQRQVSAPLRASCILYKAVMLCCS